MRFTIVFLATLTTTKNLDFFLFHPRFFGVYSDNWFTQLAYQRNAVIDAKEFGRRQQDFVQALRKNAFVEAIPDAEIRSDRNQPNLPRLTLTLIIKSDKPL